MSGNEQTPAGLRVQAMSVGNRAELYDLNGETTPVNLSFIDG